MPPVFLLDQPYGDNAAITIEGATTADGFDPDEMIFPSEEKGWKASVLDSDIYSNRITIDRDSNDLVNVLALLGNSEMANMKVMLESSTDDFDDGANNTYLQQPWNFGNGVGELNISEMGSDTPGGWKISSIPTGVGNAWVFQNPGWRVVNPDSSTELLYLSSGVYVEPFSGVPLLIEVKISGMATSSPSVHIFDSPDSALDNLTSRLEIVEDGTYWLFLTPPTDAPLNPGLLGLQADPGFIGKVEFMRWWRVEDTVSPTFNGVNAAWVNLDTSTTDRYIRLNFYNASTSLKIDHIDYDSTLSMPSFINTDFKNFEVNGTVLESQGGFYVSSNIESIIQVFPLQWPVIKEDSEEFANILTWSEGVWKKLRPWFIIPDAEEDLIFFVWPPINKVRFSAVLDSKSLGNIRIASMSCRARGD